MALTGAAPASEKYFSLGLSGSSSGSASPHTLAGKNCASSSESGVILAGKVPDLARYYIVSGVGKNADARMYNILKITIK